MTDGPPMKRFTKSFTQQEPIPEAGIARAVEIMRSGRLQLPAIDDRPRVADLTVKPDIGQKLVHGVPYCDPPGDGTSASSHSHFGLG